MPARIIQENSAPLNTVDVDGVTVDLIENALKNAREEMDAVLFRTAMSPGIREQGDCFPMIANRDGKMVVGQFGSFIGPFLSAYDADIEEGDIILTNDPYMCNGAVSHLPDWVVLVPVFKDGRHIAWSAMFGHMSDNGGMVPGSIPIKATTIYQEGIRIPPTKLYKKGVLQEDVLELILHNVRMPQWNRFDLNALVAACKTAARRCVEIAERFGDDVLATTMDVMLKRNYDAMKHIIENFVPEEPREFEDYLCDDGMGMGPYRIKCRLWREAGADLSVAVNLAGRQLLDSGLADTVRREAEAAEVSPERITLEFQEEFELLNEEMFDSLDDARRKLALWRYDYNNVRPHSSLSGMTPSDTRRAIEQSEGSAPGALAQAQNDIYQPQGLSL